MKVRELRLILQRLQEVFSSAGSRQPTRDLEIVVEVLGGSEDKTVERFVSEAKSLLDPDRPRPKPPPTPNEIAITRYVRKLLDASDDREAFEALLEALRTDERIGKDELFAIANRFFNEPTGSTYVFKFKSKTAAYAFMRKKFVERAQLDSKFRIIDKLTQSR
jgi:hypothetical protein